MADFATAFNITNGNEGGWQNDPSDRGNAPNGLGTYKGIASRMQPAWSGWATVKAAISAMAPQPAYDTKAYYTWVKKLNATLAADADLQTKVRDFYKVNFWDVNKLDQINSQAVANKVYDCGVNQGTGAAAIILQKCVGVMADGSIGPVTIAAVNKLDGTKLASDFRVARIARYRTIVANNPSQAKYLDNWISRC